MAAFRQKTIHTTEDDIAIYDRAAEIVTEGCGNSVSCWVPQE